LHRKYIALFKGYLMKKKLVFAAICLLAGYMMAIAPALKAQDDTTAVTAATITGEGINGDVDKHRRAPTVTVGVHNNGSNVQILVDAYIADEEYADYPIQFEFFINRKFFTSQIRSKDLPGPIGIDVSSSTAAVPFNYTIIATTLHTNRQFKSIVNGAVFSSNLSSTFDCTLTTGVNSDQSVEYVVNNANLSQTTNNNLTLNIETNSTPEGHSVKAAATITVTGTTATASLVIAEDEGESKTIALSGTAEKTDNKLTSLTLNSEDSDVALSCS
jgi:hypothetical protein